MTAGVLHVLVPRGVDDPLRPSGGNTYDRRVCAALRDLGRQVEVGEVEGGWPWTRVSGGAACNGPSTGSRTGRSCSSTGCSRRGSRR